MSATWDVTSHRRNLSASRPAEPPRSEPRRVAAGSRRIARSVGASPKKRAARSDRIAVTTTTRPSICTASCRKSKSGGNAESRPASVHCATRSPSAPPAAQNTRHSTIDWRSSCPRPAPIARRIPYSRCLATPRAASRPARFEQAMSRTSATMPIRETSGLPTPSRRTERPVPPGRSSSFFSTNCWRVLSSHPWSPGTSSVRSER